MTGGSETLTEWPDDPDFGGPYGYCAMIIQKDGFRLGCNGPFVPLGDHGDLYRTLAEVQQALIDGKPRSMDEAFEIQRRKNAGTLTPIS